MLLCAYAGDIVLQLQDTVLQNPALSRQRLAARQEETPLPGQYRRDLGIRRPLHQLVGEMYRLCILLFGQQTGFRCSRRIVAALQNSQRGAGARLIQPDQHIPCRYPVAVTYHERLDHAAFRMLNLLAAAVDHHDTGSDHRAGERSHGGPSAEPPEHQQNDHHSKEYGWSWIDRRLGFSHRFSPHLFSSRRL